MRDDEAYQRLFEHGGDINAARLAFPEAAQPWIDLSTGVNPVAYPVPEIAAARWARLPDPADLTALQTVAAARYGARPEQIVVAPGTQALIQWLPRLFPAPRVAVLGLTYSGHATAWRATGAEVETAATLAELEDAPCAVVVNPNNPDGRRSPPEALRALAAARRGGLLVVDEAFADFEPHTLAADPPEATVVLRSFGKAYGLAGVRLGFAVTRADIAARLREALGAWPVSGPALEIGLRALADAPWLAQASARLRDDGRWLDAGLARAGFSKVGGAALFRLARRADAERVFAQLGEAGVLTRPFRHDRELLRFGLPAPGDRARVEAALAATASTRR